MSIPASVGLNAYANAMKTVASAGKEAANPKEVGGQSFGDLVNQSVSQVVETGKASESQSMAAIAKQGDVVNMVTAVSEAEATVQTVVAIRDKVINAYQEILRMPI